LLKQAAQKVEQHPSQATRVFALGARGIYLLTVDTDGFQVLERYAYPIIPR
jgi:hypothetical protein